MDIILGASGGTVTLPAETAGRTGPLGASGGTVLVVGGPAVAVVCVPFGG